jgi:hypothetical protein
MSIYGKVVNRQGEDVAQQPRLATRSNGTVERTAAPLVNAKGEYNAYDKKDLINILRTLSDQMDSGELKKVAAVDEEAATRLVTAALTERNADLRGGAFERVGQVVTDMISETMGRQSFSDKIFARMDAKEGVGFVPPVKVDQMDVVAWHLVANGQVAESLVNPKFIYPEGYWLQSLIYVEEQDLYFAGSAFLEQKHQRGLEAMLVRQDNVAKFLLDQAAPVANDVVTFGTFTPTAAGILRDQVWRWALTPTTMLLAVDLQRDILADDDWHNVYSPIEKHVLFEEGKFGEIYGMEVFTDGYRYPTLRVLDQGEVYILSAPTTLGVHIPLIPLYSEPVNRHFEGIPKKGFFVASYQATVVANSKGVSKGMKI